jgi:hypothetical protein
LVVVFVAATFINPYQLTNHVIHAVRSSASIRLSPLRPRTSVP